MRKLSNVFVVVIAVLAIAGPAWAGAANMSVDPGRVQWDAQVDYERAVLTVSMPDGQVVRQEFDSKQTPVFELAAGAKDGAYTYELRLVARIDASLRKALAEARKSGDEALIAKLRAELPESPVVSGGFMVEAGSIVMTEGKEPQRPKSAKAAGSIGKITAEDQVIPDDLIVQGSGCFGFDCVNNESFGFDTIRLKENNLRIKFEDTSVGTFPTNDWQLTANDSASGGSSKFSIEDITGAKVPFTITAGASTNSIFVDSTGRVGFRTSTPVLDLHVSTSNTPAIRLEQTNAGGFTAQTWDIAGNEANFFVRDVTSGSRLPFRIRPGAPTSSIDISASGNVGIGTASPTQELTVKSDAGNENVFEILRSNADNQVILRFNETAAGAGLLSIFDEAANEDFRLAGTGGHSWLSGTVGINCNASGGFDFGIKSGTGATTTCNTGTFSVIDAGQTSFTIASSRTIKDDIQPVRVPDILEKIEKVDVYTYDYIEGPKDRLGIMAEDFHQIFGRGSDKLVNGQEVEMALWLAVKELTKQNQALAERLEQLEAQSEQ